MVRNLFKKVSNVEKYVVLLRFLSRGISFVSLFIKIIILLFIEVIWMCGFCRYRFKKFKD